MSQDIIRFGTVGAADTPLRLERAAKRRFTRSFTSLFVPDDKLHTQVKMARASTDKAALQ